MDLLPVLVGAIIGSLITFLLSILRFRVEKRWEQRLHAYEQVIEALHHERNYPSYFMDVEVEGRKMDGDERQKLAEKASIAKRQIELAISQGFLVLGEDVRDRLKRYQNEAGHYAIPREDWFGRLELDWERADVCLKDIIEFAKRDLDSIFGWRRYETPTPSLDP